MYNYYIQWLAEEIRGLQDAPTFDLHPLARRKLKDYDGRPLWCDIPFRMLRNLDETFSEVIKSGIAKTAVYTGKCGYEMY